VLISLRGYISELYPLKLAAMACPAGMFDISILLFLSTLKVQLHFLNGYLPTANQLEPI